MIGEVVEASRSPAELLLGVADASRCTAEAQGEEPGEIGDGAKSKSTVEKMLLAEVADALMVSAEVQGEEPGEIGDGAKSKSTVEKMLLLEVADASRCSAEAPGEELGEIGDGAKSKSTVEKMLLLEVADASRCSAEAQGEEPPVCGQVEVKISNNDTPNHFCRHGGARHAQAHVPIRGRVQGAPGGLDLG